MVIKNGAEVGNLDFLLDKWKIKEVYGEDVDFIPPLCLFKNSAEALELLHKHVENNSRIIFHTDVDVDGIGTTFIIKRAIENFGSNQHIAMINKEKIHGIQQKHVDYINHTKCADLVIITDSSSNNIDIIKQFNCDVLCIDHHEMEQDDTIGKCLDGIHDYVIVNNTISNTGEEFKQTYDWLKSKNTRDDELVMSCNEYKSDRAMSCGVVVYEFLRLYGYAYDCILSLEQSKLVQWAGITLYTDVIDTVNQRNQWYISQTLMNPDVEHTLRVMLNVLTSYKGISYKSMLDKNYIQYKFAPVINKAIRAGHGDEVLNIVLNEPARISEVQKYGELQTSAVDKAIYTYVIDDESGVKTKVNRVCNNRGIVELNTKALNIHPNYFGVIAGKLCDANKHCSVVYTEEIGIDKKGNAIKILKGSFRGGIKTIDYRSVFLNYTDGDFEVKAQGHTTAFGFEATPEQTYEIMKILTNMEDSTIETKPFLTIGDMAPNEMGTYHIDNFDDFKRAGGLVSLATGNSRVITNDEIMIRVRLIDVELESTRKTSNCSVYNYKFGTLNCTSFSEINGIYVDIYVEMNNKLDAYIKEAR